MGYPGAGKKEALEYYRSYFEDAGEENEANVIQELGSPGKVAAVIKADLVENREEYGEYTETGYTDERFDNRDMPETRNSSENEKQKNNESYGKSEWNQNSYTIKKERSGISRVLIIVLIILGAPIWGGIGLGLLGILLGIIAVIFGIIVGVLFGGIGLIVGGVAAFVQALVLHMASPATAMAATGIALLLIAVGLLLMTLFIWLTFKVFPICFRWSIDFIQRILHRGRVGGDAR